MFKQYDKQIANIAHYPWFSWFKQGLKRYEGRLNDPTKDWTKMQKGDIIRISPLPITSEMLHGRDILVMEIVNILYFTDFDEAYTKLGMALIPRLKNDDSANTVYMRTAHYTAEQIKQHGVICVELRQMQVSFE